MWKRLTALLVTLLLVVGSVPTAFAWYCWQCGSEMNLKFCTMCGEKKQEMSCPGYGVSHGAGDYYYCSTCGMQLKGDGVAEPAPTETPVPALPDQAYVSGELTYRLDDRGDAVIVKYTGRSRSVTVPAALAGHKVVGIDDRAFYEGSMTSITLPDTLVSIGDHAFYKCDKLITLELPDGVTSIGNYAFYLCTGLKNISLSAGLVSIGDYAFSRCAGLSSITWSDGLISVGDNAFSRCGSLTEVTLPGTVDHVGSEAFYLCVGLMRASLPKGLTSIGDRAFEGCPYLTITCPRNSYAWRYATQNKLSVTDGKATPTPEPTATPTPRPTAAPAALKINTSVIASKGEYTISWTGGTSASAPYRISYELADAEGQTFGDSGIYGNSCRTVAMIPGQTYLVTLTDASGRSVTERVRVPSASSFVDGSIKAKDVNIQISTRKDEDGVTGSGGAVYVQSFNAKEMTRNIKNKGWAYGLYYRIKFPSSFGQRTYLVTVVLSAPNGYQYIWNAAESSYEYNPSYDIGWRLMGADFFQRLVDDYGEVPAGKYCVDMYWDGMLVNAQEFKVN